MLLQGVLKAHLAPRDPKAVALLLSPCSGACRNGLDPAPESRLVADQLLAARLNDVGQVIREGVNPLRAIG